MEPSRVLTAVVVGGRLRDHDPGSPPAPWWSLTKTALAAAALALVADGRLRLDAASPFGPFTLRQLLAHTAGVRDYGPLRAYHEAVTRGDEPWSDDELTARAGADRPLFSPGRGWSYSNVGYLFVRRMIERVAGDDLDVALNRLVFDPLGVSGVRLARTPEDLARTAWGNAAGYHPGWVYHGLLLGTPAAAALFVHRLLSGRVLPGALLDAMRERRFLGVDVPGRPWRTAAYGLGLMIDVASPSGRCFGHTGQGPGSVASAFHFPDREEPCTTAAFAQLDDAAIVERMVLGLARAAVSGAWRRAGTRPSPSRRA